MPTPIQKISKHQYKDLQPGSELYYWHVGGTLARCTITTIRTDTVDATIVEILEPGTLVLTPGDLVEADRSDLYV